MEYLELRVRHHRLIQTADQIGHRPHVLRPADNQHGVGLDHGRDADAALPRKIDLVVQRLHQRGHRLAIDVVQRQDSIAGSVSALSRSICLMISITCCTSWALPRSTSTSSPSSISICTGLISPAPPFPSPGFTAGAAAAGPAAGAPPAGADVDSSGCWNSIVTSGGFDGGAPVVVRINSARAGCSPTPSSAAEAGGRLSRQTQGHDPAPGSVGRTHQPPRQPLAR